MTGLIDLKTALLDLLYETRESELKLIVGGGYGLYLKREYARETGVRTLLAEWPEARSTNDIDLFLRPHFLIEPANIRTLGPALGKLGYKAIAGAEKYQFARPGPTGSRAGSLKFDLLTGPRSCFAGSQAKADDRRVRPKPSIGIHAHPVDEAITLEEGLLNLTIEGRTSGGVDHEGKVSLPQPLTFAMMKLFAFRDRSKDTKKEFGRYHALDLYASLATANETEWQQAVELQRQHRASPEMEEAVRIVQSDFAERTSMGMLRLRESPYFRESLEIDGFLSALHELFAR